MSQCILTPACYKVCVLLDNHFLLVLDVDAGGIRGFDAAALQLGVHQNEVSACINSCKGYSFSQFINGYRVTYAQQLLRDHPEKKMAQVGLESGFANDTTFYRVFKAITGLTPSEWLSKQ